MTDATRILKSALARQGLRYQDLAKLTALALSTVEKIATGASHSKRGRRKIEAALGVEIWPKSQPAVIAAGPAVCTSDVPFQNP